MRKHKVTTCKKEDVLRMAGNGHSHEAILARARGFGNNLPSRLNVQHEFAGPTPRVRVFIPDNGMNPHMTKLMEPGSQIQIYDPKNPPPEILRLEAPKKPVVSGD